MLSVKPWRTEAVFLFLAAQAFCILSGCVAMGLLQTAGVTGFKGLNDTGNILLSTLSFQGATWILMVLFFRYHHVGLSEGLGFNKKLPLSLLLAVCATIVVLPIAYHFQKWSFDWMQKIGWKPEDEAAVKLLTNATSRAALIYLGFFAVVLAPVAEEFIFRGVLFPFLKQLGFRKSAWVGVNLLFALMHLDTEIFIPLFILSLALTWLYETTDCLLAPIFAHALFNAAGLIEFKNMSQ